MITEICVKCNRELVCIKNDIPIVLFEKHNAIDAMRYGDLYECPVCEHQVVLGLGAQIHCYELSPDFKLAEYIEVKRG